MAFESPAPRIAPVEKFLACVHCGLCLPSCPTYVETANEADSPRGRIYLMKALEEGRLVPSDPVVRHLDLCLGCRACETACPSGVEYGLLIEGARSYIEGTVRRGVFDRLKRRALARILPKPERLNHFRRALRLAARLGLPRLAAAPWLPAGLRRAAALTPAAPRPRPLPEVVEPAGAPRGSAALLTGCVGGALFPQVNEASARLLALAGYRVVVPAGQLCCGALSAHLGDEPEARRLARKNVNVFLRSDCDWIATNAAGCGAMMRGYGRSLGADPPYAAAAERLAAKVRDVTELLAAADLPTPERRLGARVAYHDACHLAHGQGIRDAPRKLLRSVPGLELVELAEPELCCGSAGTYNLTEPEMAWRLGMRKAKAILEAGPDMVSAGNPGCIIQIRAALRLSGRELPILHPVEILGRAHGVMTG